MSGVVITVVVTALVGAVLTGLMPVLATKVIVRLYPRDDPRRQELLAELLAVPFVERLPWVFQSLGLALTEGLPNRWRGWRSALEAREERPFTALVSRAFDIAIALVALVLTAPLVIVAAIAIKLSSKGPVLFRQTRVGRDGATFGVLKFRTMVVDAEARLAALHAENATAGTLFKLRRDPRITKVGALLRRTSIAELPQFVNVLRGEMSVVGPRPALPSEVEHWTDDVHGRLRVPPGITGLWQVSDRSDTTFDEYKRLDLEWVSKRSVRLYLRVIARTFVAVLRHRQPSRRRR